MNKDKNTLDLAARNGHTDTVELLLGKGDPIEADNNTPLHLAARNLPIPPSLHPPSARLGWIKNFGLVWFLLFLLFSIYFPFLLYVLVSYRCLLPVPAPSEAIFILHSRTFPAPPSFFPPFTLPLMVWYGMVRYGML